MRKHKYLAWLLVLSLLFSVFFPGMAVTYAEGANSEPAGYVAEEGAQDLAAAGSPDVVAAEQPRIHIDGVEDGQIVSEPELQFAVTVTDDVYRDIIPDVRLDGTPLTGVDGKYKAVLQDGENSIKVTAVNGAGSRAEAAFRVTYTPLTANTSEGANSVKEQLNRNLRYIVETVDNPTFGTGGGEWSILALARGNYSVPDGYYDIYYNNVVEIVQKKENKLDRNKWTEHSRLILGLTSIGKDVADVGGYSQLEKLADFNAVIKQGINGPIFALIALDSHNYEIPIVDGVAKQTTRENLIDYILGEEINKGTNDAGGWALSSAYSNPDPDITAMALQALTPYYNKDEKVTDAANRAIDWLSRIQTSDGGYASWGTSNSESSAQVIVALTGLGIDPHTDARFVKNGHSVLDALLSFAVPDGGFMHEMSMPEADSMATDQGTYALVAYDRFVNGQKRLYDMTDLVIDRPESAKEVLNRNLQYTLEQNDNPAFGVIGGEWSVLSLARGNYPVPADYYDKYYSNVVKVVQERKNELDLYNPAKRTENSRLILALTSIGKDVADVGGYSQLERLADYNAVIKLGINGPIFALLALDSHNYDIPSVDGVAEQTTREKLIEYILDGEIKKGTDDAGGWAQIGSKPDPDITAMALQALAPYYNKDEKVTGAVDRAVDWLSRVQTSDGGFPGWGGSSSESSSQVIVALTGLGIDPHTDARFIKNGHSALDALLSYALPGGGFMHVKSMPNANAMATEQGTYALVAYDRFVNGQQRLYDMTDVDIVPPKPEPEPGQIINVPNDSENYQFDVTAADSAKEITVNIPVEKTAKVIVNLPAGSPLPKLDAVKGNVSARIPQGARLVTGEASGLELITTRNAADTALQQQVSQLVPKGSKLDRIEQAFTMGGAAKVEFDQFVTLTFAGMKGKQAAYIQAGTPHAIQKVANDAEGMKSGKSEYAYDDGDRLVVKTKHFTDYVAYTTSAAETPGPGPGEGGGTNPPAKRYVTLSVDKLTINKGYVLPRAEVELQPGDTAWSLLKRELDKRGISYDFEWNEKYGSVYVQSIAGDGEFDHGSGSGWMYNVNGVYPGYGASSYTLSAGDKLEWRYTTNLGADLGEDNSKWEPLPGAGGTGGAAPIGPGIAIPQNDKTPVIQVPQDIRSKFVLRITKELQKKERITIQIPKDVKAKVILDLSEVKDDIPQLAAIKGDLSLVIEKGTRLTSGKAQIELFTEAMTKQRVQDAVAGSLRNEKLDAVKHLFLVGSDGDAVRFDKPLTVVIQGGKGQRPGWIEANRFAPIALYETASQGMQAVAGKDKQVYAYTKGSDLTIRTNQLATFVAYTASQAKVVQSDDAVRYADEGAISTWAADPVREATQHGFIRGSNGKFHPKSNVTRAEFTKILVTALGIEGKSQTAASFADVAADAWYSPYVHAASSAGLVTGYNDRFEPQANMTREQMASIISRALNLTPMKPASALKDAESAAPWARADIETVAAYELMSGDNQRFRPKSFVTREMAAVVAVRVHDYQQRQLPENTKSDQADGKAVTKQLQVNNQIEKTAAFLQKSITDPGVASVGGDWTVFGLARSGVPVPDAYYDKYYANVEKTVKKKSGKLHHVKYTEYDRVILALASIGKKADNVAGYNLIAPLADFDTVIKQGINGPIFALIALDSRQYDIPAVQAGKSQTTRERLIEFILNRELDGGGWALGEKPVQADPDITAMAIQGLAPYYKTNASVKAAVDRGVAWLSAAQTADGGFASWESANSESVAQVVVALTRLGIDPHTDARFTKNGTSAVDALLAFAASGGGFYHVKPGGTGNGGAKPGEVDLMATDQALYALAAYERFVQGQAHLYDLSDVK